MTNGEYGIPDGYKPTAEEVKEYLKRSKENENANNKELALKKLFHELCPDNNNIADVLIKCSALNDFYSTNIFDVYSIAQHIVKMNIDNRLRIGDPKLVKDIAEVKVGKSKTKRTFYSFATKYCSHHQEELYPIYDSYVERVLWEFKKRGDRYSAFKREDLKEYEKYKKVIDDFRNHYGLKEFTYKEIDQYLWQIGKLFFAKDKE